MGEVLYKFGAQIPQKCEFSQKKVPAELARTF